MGASVAGVGTARALRRGGDTRRIRLLGREQHPPYDKPPLSKSVLLDGTLVPLATPDQLAAEGIELELGTCAVALDPHRNVITTETGADIAYDRLVVATGATARSLPGSGGLPGVFTVRDADDAHGLRSALASAGRAVVIGAGFIGAEVAGAARALGVEVTIVETLHAPLATMLGAEAGSRLADIHTLHGTELITGTAVTGIESRGQLAVLLADGRRLPADVVIVGVGARPATSWLESSGLPIDDGVLCDEELRVLGHTTIWAAGDVARRPHPMLLDDHVRIEHWTNAGEHAEIVAAAIVGRTAPRSRPPYVWSDQYGHRIQIVGRPQAGTLARLDGSVDTPHDPLTAIYTDDDGIVVGALTVDSPTSFTALRRAVARRTPLGSIPAGAA